MKKSTITLSAIAIVLLAASVTLAATLAPTVTATGTVASKCTSAVSGTLAFAIDPSGSGPLTPSTTDAGNTSPSVKCTKNSTYAVACTSAHSFKLTIGNDGTTDPITYSVTTCAASITGNGFSTVVSMPIGITIPQANYQDAQAGAHVDTITVTVTY
jgi:spore coat protein U-like protein